MRLTLDALRSLLLSECMSQRILDPVTQVELIVPDGISRDDAIEHARLRRAGKLRRLRLFPDWGHDYSLWGDGGAMSPEHFGISDGLAERLREWTAFWAARADPFEPWTDLETLHAWWQEGLSLATDLQRELYKTTVVIPEFGPHREQGWEYS
ncbi:hypothetical protein C5B99_00620 [Pseudoclavibacter sp. Z016]|nr:hypothetical protein C5B99_00620 [Pseudoclavibacter sp. Z016]